jgi:hypothetical protein
VGIDVGLPLRLAEGSGDGSKEGETGVSGRGFPPGCVGYDVEVGFREEAEVGKSIGKKVG